MRAAGKCSASSTSRIRGSAVAPSTVPRPRIARSQSCVFADSTDVSTSGSSAVSLSRNPVMATSWPYAEPVSGGWHTHVGILVDKPESAR